MNMPDSEKENEKFTGKVEEAQQPECTQIANPAPMSGATRLASKSITESYDLLHGQGDTFRQLAKLMRGTEEKFRESVLAASYLSDNLDLSVGAAAQEIAKNFSNVMKPIGSQLAEIRSLTPSPESMQALLKPITELQDASRAISGIATPLPIISNFPMPSPTIEMANILAPLTISTDPSEKIGTLLERKLQLSPSEIKRELSTIAITDRDASFNVMGYEFLFELERFLRNLIVERIFSPCQSEKEYQNHVPKAILDEWKERKAAEEKDPLIEGEYREIDYSDFTHLKMIIEKRIN